MNPTDPIVHLRIAIGGAICALRGRHSPVFVEHWTAWPVERMTWRGYMCRRCHQTLSVPDNNPR
ncbi:hypothetical protein [Actinomyces gaoshouyii]|uniref:hypothetical protein n=1 Tax=Actinomyces gaoshouyii TaxID=1960083 RepID=UPI0009C08B35|nr:hypothetical protein [Actinomyces gaoshouyii]ARD42447.1 hypothetical protein B6G06_08960 [Actinomyces gaoshouyii]